MMRGKAWLSWFLFFVIWFGGVACSKKQTESSQSSQTPASQTPAAQTPPGTSPSQQAGATPAQPAQPAPQPETAPATQSAASAPTGAPVPTGTALVVHLNNAISTKTAKTGEAFTGALAKPVIVNGETAIPQGAEVTGRVTEAKAAGKLAGAAQLGLRLTSIKVGGQSYKVSSNAFSQTSTGKGKRTAVMGGGGAGVGLVVGGLAGGKKGALIGGLAGGSAGTAGSAFTGNADITLPVESVLNFHLTHPLDLSQPTTLNSSK
jgi:hypothetical protein